MRAHQVVVDWVEEELSSGRLSVGDRLPPERALAEELGVSRAAAREGLRVLEMLGILRSGVGSGPTAGTVVVAEPSLALSAALRLHLASAHFTSAHVMQARLVLEGWAAGNTESDSPSLVHAHALLDEMDQQGLGPADFLERDAAFHVALSQATGNPLVGAMMASIRESIRNYTLGLADSGGAWTETAGRLQEEHRAILGAIDAGESATASRLVTEHIERYYRARAD